MALRPDDYNLIELCAGVGGLGLAVHIAMPRARSIAYVEREAYAAATLVARMEAGELAPAPIWSDLASFDARPWRGRVHCVASGDPCQPNSAAGKKLGADDDRFLIDQVVRVYDESGADRLFRENVTGNADGQLAALIPPLERLGCRIAAGIFTAAEVGANHKRERLFIMADRPRGGRGIGGDAALARGGGHADRGDARLADASSPAGSLSAGQRRSEQGTADAGGRSVAVADTAGRGRDQGSEIAAGSVVGLQGSGRAPLAGDGGLALADASDGFVPVEGRRSEGRNGAGPAGADVADAAGAGPQGERDRHGATGRSNPYGPIRLGGGTLEIIFAPRPADPRWPSIIRGEARLEPAVRRVADGLANRVDRLRACGNGVVSLAGAYAFCALDALLEASRPTGQPFLGSRP